MKKINLLILILICSACSSTISTKEVAELNSDVFSHGLLNNVLSRNVADGKVDYEKLKANNTELEQYYYLLNNYSPDNKPSYFPSEDHKLAYWINAYNGSVLKMVSQYYPINTVKDIKPPTLFSFLPELSGFFVFKKIVLGGDKYSLFDLENKLIRKRFNEPRVHFALNCASISCPKLPSKAFTGKDLNSELEQETIKFFNEKRNLNIDHDNKKIILNSILDWYKEDFSDLRLYISNYVSEENKKYMLNSDYKIDFIEYDWGLNSIR